MSVTHLRQLFFYFSMGWSVRTVEDAGPYICREDGKNFFQQISPTRPLGRADGDGAPPLAAAMLYSGAILSHLANNIFP